MNQDTNEEDLEIARLLIDAGYELNDVPYRSSWYKFGGTAIKMAAEYGATDIVQLMLERGADPDIPGR
jgi:ankyrin repeat protein